MRSRAWVFSFTISSLLTLPGASDASDPRESVVKIYAEHRYRDYRFPWHAGIP